MQEHLPDELRALLGELVSDIGERVYLRAENRAANAMHVGKSLTDREIADRARSLMTTADAVTAQLGGAKPER